MSKNVNDLHIFNKIYTIERHLKPFNDFKKFGHTQSKTMSKLMSLIETPSKQ